MNYHAPGHSLASHQLGLHTLVHGPSTTMRENRSITTARYSQPSEVRKYVMPQTHFWLEAGMEC
jgi:hypothetical protein